MTQNGIKTATEPKSSLPLYYRPRAKTRTGRALCVSFIAGVKKGKQETMKAIAERMLADGNLALEKIAEYAGLSLDEVKKLQAGQSV